jgi:predicted ester cyclase
MSTHNRAIVRRLVAGIRSPKTFSGTHRGPFMGTPPTGKRATFDAIDLMRLRDGRVVEPWVVLDVAGLMRQSGVMRRTSRIEAWQHDQEEG